MTVTARDSGTGGTAIPSRNGLETGTGDWEAALQNIFDPGGKRAAVEAEMDRKHPDRVHKREWRKAAHAEGKSCGECGQQLPDGRAYLYNDRYRALATITQGDPYPVCPPCAGPRPNHWHPSILGDPHYLSYGAGHSVGAWHDEPCGGCDRPLHVGMYRAGRFYCSRACREQGRNRRAREWRVRRREVQHRECAICGDTFTMARADSRFCSNACRQKAYRHRRRLDGAR